ncbi:MAG: CoA transferase, partial [Deltaproteobacteria bacterium]|nr:CoA transferase [Deltaproteobacteria bacterium]MBW2468126.1 CoA transferase [Deltaproteobacteria bacterium]
DARRKEIIEFMRTTFKKKTLAEWDQELADLDICWGRIQALSEVIADPLFREREMILEVPGASGEKQTVIGVPVKLSDTPGSVRSAAVDFGASTSAILKELGYSEEKIAKFAETEVI